MLRLLSALAVVLALAACGKSEQDRYRDDYPSINRDLAALAADVEAGLRSAGQSSDAALADRFAGYARRLDTLRDRLDDLQPPSSVAAAHAQLTQSATSTERSLADLVSAARAGDTAAARAAATRLVRSGQDLDSARAKVANSDLFH